MVPTIIFNTTFERVHCYNFRYIKKKQFLLSDFKLLRIYISLLQVFKVQFGCINVRNNIIIIMLHIVFLLKL